MLNIGIPGGRGGRGGAFGRFSSAGALGSVLVIPGSFGGVGICVEERGGSDGATGGEDLMDSAVSPAVRL